MENKHRATPFSPWWVLSAALHLPGMLGCTDELPAAGELTTTEVTQARPQDLLERVQAAGGAAQEVNQRTTRVSYPTVWPGNVTPGQAT